MPIEMNLTNKLLQEDVLNYIEKTDWVEGNDSPYAVELDPTSVCDLACPGCISEDVIAAGHRFDKERLLELGQEMIDAGVKAVILIGGGEPLAHPKAGELIDLLGKNDVHVGITTNGSFIDRYIEPISNFSKWTRVSMDAGSSDMFKRLRPTKTGKSKFTKIISNMELLAKSKKGKMGYSYLIQTHSDGIGIESNIHEIYKAAKLAKDVGCDYFEVKPTYQFRNDVPHALMVHDKYLMNQAREQINKLDDLEDENFSILKAINLKFSLDGVDAEPDQNYTDCPSAHLRTLVTPSGVFVCPYWRAKDSMKVGDVVDTSFSEVAI